MKTIATHTARIRQDNSMPLTRQKTFSRFLAAPVLMLIALVCFGAGAACAAEDTATPFEKTIRLDLWGKHLGDAVSQITERSGVDVRVSTTFIRPRDFPSYTLYIKSDRIPVRLAIEWICRSLGCRYRIDGPHSVLLTGSYDWLQENHELSNTDVLIQSIDPILGPDTGIPDTRKKLEELVKVYSLFEEYSLRIEKEDGKIVAILPGRLKQILQDSLTAMTNPGQTINTPPDTLLSNEDTALLNSLRNRVIANYKNQNARDVIMDLALQSGVNLAFSPKPFVGREIPTVTIELGETPLRAALESLTKELGLKGQELYRPNGVFLVEEDRKWDHAPSREFVWETLQTQSYAIRELAAKSSGDAVAHHVRRQVTPDAWQDPCTAAVYHEPSGNLIVVGPEALQHAVRAELYRLSTKP